MRKLFGREEEWGTFHSLIRRMLSAELVLHGFGRIGSFFKAPDETRAMGHDRSNAPVWEKTREVGRRWTARARSSG